MEILTEECVKLVTIHGRPFSVMDDKGFQNIVTLIPQNSNKIHFNSHNIKQSVATYAEQIREKICGEINGKVICLKIDAASCIDIRSFFGINIQFVDEDLNIVLRTLAVTELFSKHDAVTLKNVVLDVCHQYNICVQDIFSVTTDNGTNMIKLVRLLGCESR